MSETNFREKFRMKLQRISSALSLSLLMLWACACSEDPAGPNDIGGETDLDLTEVGNTFPVNLSTESFIPGIDQLQDSIVITGRDGGIVSVHARFTFDSVFVEGLDSALGTSGLPEAAKRAILDVYLDRYGATLDTTDREAMTLEVDGKLKVTSEGIQEFISSDGDLSRPFTIVKYDAEVGDTWNFTDSEGVVITRSVTYRSQTDDYPVAFWMLKIIKVEETREEDPLIERITYYTNHKYGLVGMEILTKNGRTIEVGILPPTLE